MMLCGFGFREVSNNCGSRSIVYRIGVGRAYGQVAVITEMVVVVAEAAAAVVVVVLGTSTDNSGDGGIDGSRYVERVIIVVEVGHIVCLLHVFIVNIGGLVVEPLLIIL